MRNFLLLLIVLSMPVSAYYHHDSPIEWREYGQDAFALAEKDHKPVFMLITAVWCYWCHVYRDETLHAPEVASYINEHFVPVFVDADKRQDLTRQYLAGGWPSTVIFSPQGDEVNRINGMIAKEELLTHLQKVSGFFASGQTVPRKQVESARVQHESISNDELDLFWNSVPMKILSSYDRDYGGIGGERKFPLGQVYEFLLYRYERTKEPILLEATELALNNMAPQDWINFSLPIDKRVLRGVFDPIEGGFFRYDVNRDWSVPHYEKMLTTNAYTIRAYLNAYKTTRNERYKEIAEKSLAYVGRSLQDSKTGRLYGSQDAGHEKYYLQDEQERQKGKYEQPPRIDTTTYADWSGPMISTFLMAADILDNSTYANNGLRAASFIRKEMTGPEGVLHFYDKNASLSGLLLDNAEIASAFLDVYRFTNDSSYLRLAEEILLFAQTRLYNSSAGVYYERNSSDTHLYRDDAFLPEFSMEGNTAMAFALMKAHKATGKQEYLDRARSIMGYLVKDSGSIELMATQAIVADYLRTIPDSLELKRKSIHAGFVLLLFVSFFAGMLSFLSPCTLPLLPAYVIHTINAERDAVKRTVAFFFGLAMIFSAIGVSAALVGSWLVKVMPQISKAAGAIIILFGALTLLGKGFHGFRMKRFHDGVLGSFLFGASYGVAWTPCVGPILGSIFVIASTTENWLKGGVLLFAYALGIAIPLLGLSFYIDRSRHEGRIWKLAHGKAISLRIGRWRIHTHTTNIIAGILLILIGYLILSGTLYSLNQLAVDTILQKKLFGLEEAIVRLIR